eukprot:12838398-Heterocapsa_arctica.AAC.1
MRRTGTSSQIVNLRHGQSSSRVKGKALGRKQQDKMQRNMQVQSWQQRKANRRALEGETPQKCV